MASAVEGCKIIEFESIVHAGRRSALPSNGGLVSIIPFPARLRGEKGPRRLSGTRRGGGRASWRLSIAQRTGASAKMLGNAKNDIEFSLAGLAGAIQKFGIRGIAIPSNSAEGIERSLTYRVPREEWEAMHRLDYSMQEKILLAMLEAVHDGRVRCKSEGSAFIENGHQLLPMELAGESTIHWEICALMRILPCLGLDRGVEDYSDYGTIFAYEDDGAADSLCYEPLIERFRKERAGFVKENQLFNVDDLAGYIMAYGRNSELLGDAASEAFQERGFAHKTALMVLRSGPDRDMSKW